MQIVLLNGLLAATGVNFIAGAPFEVYWGANCITDTSLGATGAQFLLLECLLLYTGAKVVLPKCLFGATGANFITGRLF